MIAETDELLTVLDIFSRIHSSAKDIYNVSRIKQNSTHSIIFVVSILQCHIGVHTWIVKMEVKFTQKLTAIRSFCCFCSIAFCTSISSIKAFLATEYIKGPLHLKCICIRN